MGASAAEIPISPDEQPAAGLRASDADRDQVVSRLRDEYVAGRLSQETFLHRINLVLETKRQVDLPPLLADLPQQPAGPDRGPSLAGWLRGTWYRVTGMTARARPARDLTTRRGSGIAARGVAPVRAMTTGMRASAGDRGAPLALQFPRGSGDQFSIGRDASCDLAIADVSVSRWHAQLERTAGGWLLSDLESTNGTRVNGWRVRGKVPVRAGDLVSFGNLEAIFARGDE